MFEDAPYAIRLRCRPCTGRDDCFQEWEWLSARDCRVRCKTCGDTFQPEQVKAGLIFTDEQPNAKDKERADELAKENQELKRKLKVLKENSGAWGKAPKWIVSEPPPTSSSVASKKDTRPAYMKKMGIEEEK